MTDTEKILFRLVQIGVVTDRDTEKHKARVIFPTTEITSDWLYVLDNKPFIPGYDVPQETEPESGGSGEEAFAEHKHDLVIKQWMPSIGDRVLVLFLPMFNSDGFILGGIS